MVAQSSVEAEWAMMPSLSGELVWVKQFLQELKFCEIQQIKMCCYNQFAFYIASNLVFHGKTKHIELDCYII